MLFRMKAFPDIKTLAPGIDIITDELIREKNISLSVLRLDKIHPFISGNKLFKLYYYLIETLENPGKKIVTFGGAWSNHLAVTAAACKENNIGSVVIVRGERPISLSGTLRFCFDQGMHIEFIYRKIYKS